MQHFTVLFESGLVAGPYCWGWVASRLDKEKFYPIVTIDLQKLFLMHVCASDIILMYSIVCFLAMVR